MILAKKEPHDDHHHYSTDTDKSLRMFLASQGGGRKGDLSRFVEEAVRAHILELSAEQAKISQCKRERRGCDING